ncbi:hypothetical protein NAEGRDRAFT_78034 [Naegleria gruberi]|uniref:CRAL-TRIO domain-containing protein n=2 Tax=Naegleria gruberi TaxID=5762 RepID=D2V0F0_NAEGR|nr:uncharacterized protein NAEGRDRAFT_78034 [Naegleria gruberi]EFC49514.1 hypothetical protein NAEGRDRAFT_78034 [Naegleria gruberi]|eukprot:XP_002682258.1 hypothetical protein NAEGRDRAFT_78034 [Naegleria gruberi strain NEG-M]
MSERKGHTRMHSATSFIDVTKGYNPRTSLTQEQNEILNDFIKKIDYDSLTDRERKYLDEPSLLRFLRARDYDLNKAEKLMNSCLEWRRTFKPDEITAKELEDESSSGKLFQRGFDKNNRPIIYMFPARENSTDYEKNIKLLVYTMERAVDAMPEGVEQMTWIIDFNGYTTRNAPPFSVAKQTLSILNECYPERLGACFMVDTPFIFNIFWRAISPFINPVTKNKIHFVNGKESEKAKIFGKHIDLAQIDTTWGGTSTFVFEHSDFWGNVMELDKHRLKRLGITQDAPVVEEKKFENTNNTEGAKAITN